MHRGSIPAILGGVALAGVCVAAGVVGMQAPSSGAIITIEVAGEQTYRIELIDPAAIATAEQLFAGEIDPLIPLGTIVRDDPGPNAPWSWHIDPASFEWAELAIEVCDGLPEYVEDGTLTSPTYCPWSTEIIAIE